MRALIQKVSRAEVRVDHQMISRIDRGILVLLGVTHQDREPDADYLLDKLIQLRIFPDVEGKMNLSLNEISGQLMVISQFTLYGDCRRGRRPSFTDSAKPEAAEQLYHYFIEQAMIRLPGRVAQGVFGAMMEIELVNDGPVTFMLESEGRPGR
ncbi:MAG: D-tyrosyl-tRNA(Tyr) deacylase [Candidatus Delongbacteria bacterium]|nr:D-tyrosyl-tRNA(Tyr) deacylase [Candidatus Delongbacteria bacterium]